MNMQRALPLAPIALGLALALSQPSYAADTDLQVRGGTATLQAGDNAPAYTLKVAYPDGRVVQTEILAGERMPIDPKSPGGGYAEGYYQIEISPILGFAQRQDGDQSSEQKAAEQNVETITRGFRVVKGEVIVASPEKPNANTTLNDSDYGVRMKDQVISDDLIVDGSACVGLDCVNGESFGFDTIRMKENNVRIHFDDTSNSASFPNNDWRLIANDSTNGGDNYLAIEDSTAGRQIFKVQAGAAANSLFVKANGNVGLGTGTPVVQLHVLDGNTPTLRLDQDGSSGFASQVWDVAGNEANFFIRDATNGSTLPFKIRPSSPNNMLTITPAGVAINKNTTNASGALDVSGTALVSGKMGVGTSTPVTTLDVANSIRAANTDSGDVSFLALGESFDGATPFYVQRYGSAHLLASGADIWNADNGFLRFGTSNSERLRIDQLGNVGIGTTAPTEKLHVVGNITATGTISQTSDRNAKFNIVETDVSDILDRIARVPISFWTYKTDSLKARHMGPMAQDFYAAFGLGDSNRVISPLDAAGVALAAIQALNEKLAERDSKIEMLERRIDLLTSSVAKIAERRPSDEKYANADEALSK